MNTDCGTRSPERISAVQHDASNMRRILNATCVSYVVVLLDTSIVNVALEPLAHAFDVQMTGLQWVVGAYTLLFASLLLTGGTLGDRWGAKRGYLAGLLIFMMASLGCALARSPSMLIAARALQGIGAALLVPCSLKLIHQATPDPAERTRAIGRWVGLGGVALAAGPLVGGVLIHWLGWRSIFLVNVPVCLAGAVMAGRLAGRFGPVRPVLWAFVAYAAGAVGLAFVTANVPYAFAVLPMLAIGAASGVVSPIATAPALQTVAPARAGVAAAVLNTARQAGAALGVAIFGSLAGTVPPAETGLYPALGLAVGVSLAMLPAWRLALREWGPHAL
ncbi:MFS transporter [Pandoraea sp. SD6-2]|uniref:MFS transporter n=1 Tax=Pandoraea sp. SD6-2 TaxID=1286093 RepID=UPI00032DFD79|nr:MFS transporter [Pandoraea sp. SD6-2]EON12747.1 major facilitator superfamily protein [Pandoraea sp. SD6-2]